MISALSSTLIAQEAKTQLHTPEKLTELLALKIDLDREASEKKQFTIQVYYGDFETTSSVLESFKIQYPQLTARLIFETPNYKVRTGFFTTEREAVEVLTQIKRYYKGAFVLKP